MNQLITFCKKEWMEMIRTGRLILLFIIFCLFGIMNPAIAKLTPWMFDMLSDTLEEQGMIIMEVAVDAMTSWTQFYKNIPIGLIVLVILFSGIMTNEYLKGTLINMLTKGLARWKVIIGKSIVMIVVWTLCYAACFLITYGYNAYFWDNGVASHIFLGAVLIYLFSIWLISLILLASSIFRANFSVMLTVALAVAGCYLIGIVPTITEYLPTQLMNGSALLTKACIPSDFTASIWITVALIVVNFVVSIVTFNRKRL